MFLQDYYKVLTELPQLEREVLLRYYIEYGIHDITAKIIGKELGISETQVYKVKK